MLYITTPVVKAYQFSFEDILFGISQEKYDKKIHDTSDTRTVQRDQTPPKLLNRIDIGDMIASLVRFNKRYEQLIATEDKSSLYRSFKIPKRSGGLRQIDAPLDDLMTALRELKTLFEKKLYASYHTSAFAYVPKRSTIDAIRRHQQNNSRWFLKLDFHNFFGSTTPDFVLGMLKLIFPFNEILQDARGEKALKDALSLCFLNGGLPQGTPISPTLTNLMMIPIDYELAKYAREHSPHLCYTRYADDILLSSDLNFKWGSVQSDVIQIIAKYGAPFTLNTTKTRYGSSAGRNWNLGVMLNKDNQITVGHERKKVFKAMLFRFCTDYKNGQPWDLGDVQHLQGLKAYYEMVEGDAIKEIIKTYTSKMGVDIEATIKELLR